MISGEGLGPWPLWAAQGLISELSWAAGRDQSDHCGQLFLCPKSLLGAAGDVATDSGVSVTTPLPQGSGCTLAFRESEINEVDSVLGKPPVLPSIDRSVCLFPMPNIIPKSVCGLLNCQALERLGDRALETRS